MSAAMATQLPLDISLYQDSTDRDVLFCKQLLQALADGTRNAAEAAQDLDKWVMDESTRRLEELRSRPELDAKSTHETSSRASTPNASGYVELFFQGFPSLCAISPPHHEDQTRVIAFLEALMAMPVHRAPESFSNAPELSDDDSITLWPRGVIEPDTFRVHAAGMSALVPSNPVPRDAS
jgi:hypothetical protein